jgi:hypothetical protein
VSYLLLVLALMPLDNHLDFKCVNVCLLIHINCIPILLTLLSINFGFNRMPPCHGGHGGGRDHGRDGDDLPSPPPNIAEAMTNQTRILEDMIRNNAAQRAPQDWDISRMDF